MAAKWKIYLSSTYKDLKDIRSFIITEFGKAKYKDSFEFTEIMEHMYNRGEMVPAVNTCLENVTQADIYILILGKSVGSYPDDETRTYTEMELDRAISEIPLGKKVYVLKSKDFNPKLSPKHKEIYDKVISKPKKAFKDEDSFLAQIQDILFPYANTSPIITTNPYKGLAPFNIEDGEYFFGRNTEIVKCLKELHLKKLRKENLFISIVGSSGIGKTSFVQAGLLYRLSQDKDFAKFQPITIVPGNQPYSNFLYELDKYDLSLEKIASKDRDGIILFFNQFEEVISQCITPESKDERKRLFQFFDSLVANDRTKSNLIIITTFRSDFYSALANFDFIQNQQYSFALSSLDYTKNSASWETSIKEIISLPALKNGVRIEEELTNKLINEIKEVEGSLSILQFTLAQIWKPETIEDRRITSDEYNKLADGKGIEGIIEVHAEEIISVICNAADKEGERVVKSIFVNMVEVTDNLSDVKKTIKKNELIQKLSVYSEECVYKTFDYLVGPESRLLVVDASDKENPNVDIIHEVLIRKWKRLRDWIEERRESLSYEDRLTKEIRSGHELYSGSKLKELETWAQKNPDLVTENHKRFMGASKKRRAKKRILSVVAPIVLIALFSFSFKYYKQQNFMTELNHIPSVKEQVEAAGNHLDSVKSLIIVKDNYEFLITNLYRFKNLKKLEISRIPSIKDLMKFKECKSITNLTLSENIDLESLKGIENFPSLQSLSIYTNDRLKKFEELKGIKNLKYIYYSNSEEEKTNFFKIVSNLRNLDSLAISDLNYENLNKLNNLKFIKFLRLSLYMSSYKTNSTFKLGLNTFSTLTQLNSLDLDQYSYRKYNIFSLDSDKRTNIENLILTGIDSIICIKNEDLRKLELRNYKGHTLDNIHNISKLKNLTINYCDSIKTFNSLEKMKLEKLTIGGLNKEMAKHLIKLNPQTKLIVSIFDLNSINMLPSGFMVSYLNYGNDSSADLSELNKLKEITDLSISDNDSLLTLNPIHKLRIRNLSITNNLKLKDLEILSGIKVLNSLTITGNDALKSLKGIEKINKIKLLSLSADDAIDFRFLSQLKNVKEVHFDAKPKIDIDKIKSHNPNLKITIDYNEALTYP